MSTTYAEVVNEGIVYAFHTGSSIEEIAAERGMTISSVENAIRLEWTKERFKHVKFLEDLLAVLTGTTTKTIDAAKAAIDAGWQEQLETKETQCKTKPN